MIEFTQEEFLDLLQFFEDNGIDENTWLSKYTKTTLTSSYKKIKKEWINTTLDQEDKDWKTWKALNERM